MIKANIMQQNHDFSSKLRPYMKVRWGEKSVFWIEKEDTVLVSMVAKVKGKL